MNNSGYKPKILLLVIEQILGLDGINYQLKLERGMKKYGLQLRKPPGQSSKPPVAAPVRRPPPSIFGNDDDDDVEKEISRQASKTASLQRVVAQLLFLRFKFLLSLENYGLIQM